MEDREGVGSLGEGGGGGEGDFSKDAKQPPRGDMPSKKKTAQNRRKATYTLSAI